METRASYVLIGAFTLLGVLGVLAFFLWLAKVEVDRQYAYYDILFDSVAGLGTAGDVRYNGLPVGQVVDLGLDPGNAGRIRVTIEVAEATPVSTSTVATLEFQGVTGVSYVALSGDGRGGPLPAPAEGHPVIRSERSAVQTIFEGAPELLEKAIALLEEIREVVDDDNREAVARILGNLDATSGDLATMARDFSGLSTELSAAAREVAGFTDTLDGLSASAEVTLGTANETLAAATEGIRKADVVMTEASAALQSARYTFDGANGLIADDLPRLIASIDETSRTIRTVADALNQQAGAVAGRVEALANAALARLDQTEATFIKLNASIDQANETLRSVDTLTRDVNRLVAGEGAALVADARAAIRNADSAIVSLNRVVTEDVPPIVARIGLVTGEVNRLIATIGPGIERGVGRIDELVDGAGQTLESASATFARANASLEALDATLAGADRALASATRTFDGANKVLEEDIDGIVADLRSTVTALEESLGGATADIPRITEEIRRMLESANSLVRNAEGIVTDNRDEIELFTQAGLPEFVRFVQEARKLVQNLERLTAKIERDPARFLLGTQSPEFRR